MDTGFRSGAGDSEILLEEPVLDLYGLRWEDLEVDDVEERRISVREPSSGLSDVKDLDCSPFGAAGEMLLAMRFAEVLILETNPEGPTDVRWA